MQEVLNHPELELQIIVTGMHLSPEFGLTYQDIEADGFRIDRKIEILTSSDTPVGVSKSMGLGMISFAEAYAELRPDLVLVLGDRFEIFSAVSAAMVARLPIAHLHGGETTEGVIDEAIRHSITKMSHLHFVATEEYGRRVVQLGEDRSRVFVVGGLGIDCISRIKLMTCAELESSLGLSFEKKNLLVTFHPVTLETGAAATQMQELLSGLEGMSDARIIFTLPNADMGGREIMRLVYDFVAKNPNAKAFESLGQLRYLSCIACVDGVVGNSSSGLTEVPSFRKGTINIGSRQEGRLQAASVINCAPERDDIRAALSRLYSPEFQSQLTKVKNPYGVPGASGRIVDIIASANLDGILKKRFVDIPDNAK